MAIAAAAVIVPLGLLFFISGLVVNLIQAVCFVTIKPLSKSLYRRINKEVAELLWLELIWLFDWWAGIKVKLYTDRETLKIMGKEHALVISNHKSDIDWLVGWVLAQRSGCLGSALAVMKKSSKFLPVIGWSMWFSEYLFLERSWAKDEGTIKSGLQRLKDFPRPFWLALFVEGTRFTQAKLLAAQEYAASNGLPIPRNVLIPRTKSGKTTSLNKKAELVMRIRQSLIIKASSLYVSTYTVHFVIKCLLSIILITLVKNIFFELTISLAKQGRDSVGGFVVLGIEFPLKILAVSHMRSFVPAIYDVTVAIPKSSPAPTMLRMFKGQPSVVHVHLKRHAMKELPDSDDAVAQWCKDVFVAKMQGLSGVMFTKLTVDAYDALLDKHNAEDTFSDQELQEIPRPVVISWVCLVIFGALKFLQWSSLLSSWKGIAVSGFCLAIVTVLMHILILFSQSERSTPAKVAPAKPKKISEPGETRQNKQQ
ncbi:hypothetical protein Patl1_20570 [Pistacia atlantica]|uniref:Uncharacterized protein n=1 Tax=Pistacia atlantica TaxID=434234 RepID=A0ACC1BMN8_9ROSI|nr:hypothetical protein Patl1_20570 [Pistacia atlantica]